MALTGGEILRVVGALISPDTVVMQNVFHLLLDTVNGTGAADEIAADMITYLEEAYDNFKTDISDEVDATTISIYERDTVGDDWDEVFIDLWTFLGTGTSEMLPHGVAAIQSYTTVEPDVRGRKFFGGYTESSQEASVLIGASITQLAAVGIDIITTYTDAVSGNIYTPGVWSPTRNAFFAFGGTVISNSILGYQRRRKPGVGI